MNIEFVKNKMKWNFQEIKFMSRTPWVISKARGLFQNSDAGDDITISINVIHNRKNFGRNPTILQVFVFSMSRLQPNC